MINLHSRLAAIDPATTSIDNSCYDSFGRGWWDPRGPLAGLHEMNPTRARYFDEALVSLLGKNAKQSGRFLDVGCGGGILTEEMVRRGFSVRGVDISEASLEAAREHARERGIQVEYARGSAYELPADDASVAGVIISDVLEHLHDLPRAITEIARVLRPGGALVFDTISRTLKSYALMIVLAQDVLRLVHPNTHDWRLFIKPTELTQLLQDHGFDVREMRGLSPQANIARVLKNIWTTRQVGDFVLSDDLSVIYLGCATKGPSQGVAR